MAKTREERVAEFRRAGDSKYFHNRDSEDDSEMIIACIEEEANEFFEAAADYELDQSEENRAQLCKEWADLQYVVSQAADYYSIPADLAFNRVADNNMSKVVDGKVIKREDGKILKPEGYVKADMRGL